MDGPSLSCERIETSGDAAPAATASPLSKAKDGNQGELGKLLETYRPIIERKADQQLGPTLRVRVSKSDIVQDTMLAASRAFENFRGTTDEQFRAWLFRIFESRVVDNLRRHVMAEKRRGVQHDSDFTLQVSNRIQSPSTIAMTSEESRRLLTAIAELEQPSQNIVTLRYLEQKSFDAIANQLELSVHVVWRAWKRALDQLRKKLA